MCGVMDHDAMQWNNEMSVEQQQRKRKVYCGGAENEDEYGWAASWMGGGGKERRVLKEQQQQQEQQGWGVLTRGGDFELQNHASRHQQAHEWFVRKSRTLQREQQQQQQQQREKLVTRRAGGSGAGWGNTNDDARTPDTCMTSAQHHCDIYTSDAHAMDVEAEGQITGRSAAAAVLARAELGKTTSASASLSVGVVPECHHCRCGSIFSARERQTPRRCCDVTIFCV